MADKSKSSGERLYFRVREVAALTGLGLRTVYAAVYAGEIPSRKIGDARLIPAAWLHATTQVEADQIRDSFVVPERNVTLAHLHRTPKNQYSLGRSGRRPCGNSGPAGMPVVRPRRTLPWPTFSAINQDAA